MAEEPNERLKEWRRKLGKIAKDNIGPLAPKHAAPDSDTSRVVWIIQVIVLFNLIAFCTVMVIVDLAEITKPNAKTQVEKPEPPNAFERGIEQD